MIELTAVRKVHIVGIGGAGMSAIAIVLRQQGYEVSGSDLKASVAFERLRAHGVELFVGHEGKNVEGADLVAISSAIPTSNPEVKWAHLNGISVVTRSELLPAIIADKRVIGVSGTHGKTTTTSMLALSLMKAGMQPSFIVGGELNEIGTNALWDDGEVLVIEADESDGTFLHLGCNGIIVTNLEPDHLDYYGSYQALKDAFKDFVTNAQGVKIICADSQDASYLLEIEGTVSYGVSNQSDYQLVPINSSRFVNKFRILNDGIDPIEINLAVPGIHNALNATAVLAMLNEMGISTALVVDALESFTGVARRYQFRGEYQGAVLVDDYAHLPGEISVVLDAAESQGYSRIVTVFQPHRYSRTMLLYKEFAKSFEKADVIVLTDVYSAGELPLPGVTGELIRDEVSAIFPEKELHYVAHRNKLAPFVKSLIKDGDVCLTLGAGDLTMLYGEMLGETI